MSEFEPDIAGQDDTYTQACELAKIQGRSRLANHIIQTVVGEDFRPSTARDDRVWWGLHEIEEQNGMPYDFTADDLFGMYVTNYRGSYE